MAQVYTIIPRNMLFFQKFQIFTDLKGTSRYHLIVLKLFVLYPKVTEKHFEVKFFFSKTVGHPSVVVFLSKLKFTFRQIDLTLVYHQILSGA